MFKKTLNSYLLISSLFFSVSSFAALDTDADEIQLRVDCTGLSDCTTSVDEVIDWVNVDRTDKNKQVTVDIGAGTFSVPVDTLFCENSNNVAYRGAGPDITVLTDGGTGGIGNPNNPVYVVAIDNCDSLVFQDLTIQSRAWVSQGYGLGTSVVSWKGDTKSVWINVVLQAAGQAWFDNGGTHYWFGSRLEVKTSAGSGGSITYYSVGGDNWFYGSELHAIHDTTASGLFVAGAVVAGGKIRLFGSTVRVESTTDAGLTGSADFIGFGGLLAYNNGEMHVHGGIISVKANNDSVDQDVYGAKAGNVILSPIGGLVHTPDAAFVLRKSGNGVASRIVNVNQGTLQSPFQWPASSTPPDITSLTGSDTFVETDCASAGCQITGTETHLLIYNDTCITAGPWFDVVTARCRGE